jgi:ADP-heptose:LPS heptosyltransferase
VLLRLRITSANLQRTETMQPPEGLSSFIEMAAFRPKILVIKLGALGDFVQAMGPAAAIRRHHPEAEITLLTTRPYAEFAKRAPYFDEVWVDERPRLADVKALAVLRRQLRHAAFARVYDLQTSDRSSFYYHLMVPRRPEWSGIALGASHKHANPERDAMHTLDRQAEQLAAAGITEVSPPDVSWGASDIGRFGLPARIALLIPGGSAHRPEKRWPAERYGALAARLAVKGMTPVVIGGPDEARLAPAISEHAPAARDLTGKTSFGEIVGLAARAVHTIGNDTGPMHLAVAAGSPATVLYSSASDPALTAPRGGDVAVLRRPSLAALTVDQVWDSVRPRLAPRS